MIIPNGYIKIKTSTGGGFENGKPKKAIVLSSDFIEANINECSRSHRQLGDETTGTKASYTILIDSENECGISDRDMVEVFDGRMAPLGTFEIQSARFLEFTEVIKIQV